MLSVPQLGETWLLTYGSQRNGRRRNGLHRGELGLALLVEAFFDLVLPDRLTLSTELRCFAPVSSASKHLLLVQFTLCKSTPAPSSSSASLKHWGRQLLSQQPSTIMQEYAAAGSGGDLAQTRVGVR